jgi:phosphonate transport system substrate-binding protein
MLRRTFCALIIASALSAPAFAQEADTLTFGMVSSESATNLKARWLPVMDDLSRVLGRQVKPFFASDYAGVIEAMRFNKVQVASFGNQSAIEAADRSGGQVFAASLDKDGNAGYWSILLVNKASSLNTVDDIIKNAKKLNYGMGDPNSTSGTAVPRFYLWGANHVDPKQIFKTARESNHETNLMSVINKQVDVAINNTLELKHYQSNTGHDPMENVRIVWKSPMIANDPLVYRKDLSPELKSKIQVFFVNYGKTGPNATIEAANLKRMDLRGFNASSDAQLIPIRQMNFAADKAKIQSDTTMSDSDKTTKLSEIDAKLAKLSQVVAKN